MTERPDALAFIDGNRPIHVAEFDALVHRTAAWLDAHGIGAGDRVAVWMVNRIEWLALLFGLARAGATLVAVNTRYRAAELEYLLGRSGARMLVLQPGVRNIDFMAVLAETDPAALRAVEQIVVVGGQELPRVPNRVVTGFDALLHPDARDSVPDRSDPDALAVLYTTSGTTKGHPCCRRPAPGWRGTRCRHASISSSSFRSRRVPTVPRSSGQNCARWPRSC